MQTQPGGAANWSSKKLRAAKLLLVLGGVLFGLLLTEAALRLAGYSYPVFYTPDRALGYALTPNMAGWYRKEGAAYVRINSAGLRDRERARPKPAGVFRIAVLGDSYAEALQVPLENAFWYVLEERLRACGAFGGREIEVINFGVSGYGTAQELLMLRARVWAYAPDLVLLAVTTNNDITDNSRVLKGTDEIPYFVYRGERLTLDDSFLNTAAFRLRQSAVNEWGRWIRDNSRTAQAVHQAHGAFKSYLARRRAQRAPDETARAPAAETTAPPAAPGGVGPPPPPAELGIDNLIYRAPDDATWQEAWRVTEGLLALMRAEVEAGGARLLVVTLSNGIQVHPEPAARQAFMQRLGLADLFYPDRRLRTFGAQAGITVLNLAPSMQQYAERQRVFLHGFGDNLGNGHWNERGHKVAGEILAGWLCEQERPLNAAYLLAPLSAQGL